MNQQNREKTIETIVAFLNSINIRVVKRTLPNDTFLPGLSILSSSILMDLEKLKYPGDLLHEAGHIAVTEEIFRPTLGREEVAKNWPTDGDEIAAILWSFAASKHLKLDLKVSRVATFGVDGTLQRYRVSTNEKMVEISTPLSLYTENTVYKYLVNRSLKVNFKNILFLYNAIDHSIASKFISILKNENKTTFKLPVLEITSNSIFNPQD